MKALAVKADVANEQDIKSAVELAVKEFGRLDIMVRDRLECSVEGSPFTRLSSSIMLASWTCLLSLDIRSDSHTGIMHQDDDNALNTEEWIWDLTMSVNVKGVWWGCKYAILAMRQNPVDESKGLHAGGSIINTASFVAIFGAATPQLACEYFGNPPCPSLCR